MKIFYAVRLFSGLETSVLQKTWAPTGVPTIYKMMEALDAGMDDPFFILTCKENYASQIDALNGQHVLEGLRHPVMLLGGSFQYGRCLRRIKEFRQTYRLFRLARRSQADVAYFTNANFLAAALVARLTRIPTVLRIMGVYPAQRDILTGRHPAHALMRWAYRSPFACVICTQDGSGGEEWLKKSIASRVRVEIMLNGVNPAFDRPSMDSSLSRLPPHKTIVTHIGKLEPEKGIMEFMDGFFEARKQTNGALHALVVGTGPLQPALFEKVRAAKAAGDVTFITRLPHNQIPWVHHKTDIYVSLNRLGNLSNANLEAMRAGSCMIIPRSQPTTGIDLTTDRLIPDEAVRRIPANNAIQALSEALVFLHHHPAERKRLRQTMARIAAELIPTWKDRIEAEIRLLRGLTRTDRHRSGND